MKSTEISRSDVTRQLQTLGVRPGDVLLTHTSFRTARPVERGPIGLAHARLASSRDIVRVVRARLEAEPLLFLHGPDAGCADCDEARTSVGPSTQPRP